MSCIEVLEVSLQRPVPDRLRDYYLDSPVAGRKVDGDTVDVFGWVLGADGPVLGVELVSGGRVVRQVEMNHPRPDLSSAFADLPWARQAGFLTRITLPRIGSQTCTVQAVLHDRSRVPVATIKLRGRWREDRAGSQGTALVSVIVPCVGPAESLGDAIESVRAQTYPHLEVVVAGSAAPDGALAQRYPWVRWVPGDGPGSAAARNAGMRYSDGPYLVFLEPWDRLLPGALAAGLDALRDNARCALAAGACRGAGDPAPPSGTPGEADGYAELLRGSHVFQPSAVICCREALEHCVAFADFETPVVDYDMYLRLARDFPICRHAQVVAERGRSGSDADADPAARLRDTLRVLRGQRCYLKGDERRKQAYREGLRYWRDHYTRPLARQVQAHWAAGRWREARRAMRGLLRYHPEALAALWNGGAPDPHTL